MDDGSKKLLRVILVAAAEPAALLVAGAAPVVAAVVGAWFPLLLGAHIYVVLVIRNLLRPAFWAAALANRGPPRSLPDANHVFDPALRAMVCAIGAGRAEVCRVLADTPEHVRAELGFNPTYLDRLEQCASRLVTRADDLSRHIKTVRRESVFANVARLDRLMQNGASDDAKREYASARSLRREQLQALDDLTATYELMTATLSRIVATVEGLPPRLLRLRLLCTEARENLLGEVDDHLDRITGDLAASEDAFAGTTTSLFDAADNCPTC
jgi:hypothetical protein